MLGAEMGRHFHETVTGLAPVLPHSGQTTGPMKRKRPVDVWKLVAVFSAAMAFLCLPAVLFLHRGVLDDLDFWGGTFVIVLGGALELILLGWIFGIDKAWDELHLGSKLRVPRIFRFVIKYITPTCLLFLLVWYFATDWWPVIMMEGIPEANVPYILGTRLLLLAILVTLAVLVWIAWRGRDTKKYYGEE